MNTTTNSGTTNSSAAPGRDQLDAQLDTMCARFTSLRSADAVHWLAAGDRLGTALLAFASRLARRRDARRAERRDADRLAYGR